MMIYFSSCNRAGLASERIPVCLVCYYRKFLWAKPQKGFLFINSPKEFLTDISNLPCLACLNVETKFLFSSFDHQKTRRDKHASFSIRRHFNYSGGEIQHQGRWSSWGRPALLDCWSFIMLKRRRGQKHLHFAPSNPLSCVISSFFYRQGNKCKIRDLSKPTH